MSEANEGVRASISDIIDVANRVAAIAQEFDERLQAANAAVDARLHGGWTGKSGDGFADAFRDWNEGVDDVRSGLADMARALADNARAYADRDRSIADSIASQLPRPGDAV